MSFDGIRRLSLGQTEACDEACIREKHRVQLVKELAASSAGSPATAHAAEAIQQCSAQKDWTKCAESSVTQGATIALYEVGVPPEAVASAKACAQTGDAAACAEGVFVTGAAVACAAGLSSTGVGATATPLCGFVSGPVGKFAYQVASGTYKALESGYGAVAWAAKAVTNQITGECYQYKPLFMSIWHSYAELYEFELSKAFCRSVVEYRKSIGLDPTKFPWIDSNGIRRVGEMPQDFSGPVAATFWSGHIVEGAKKLYGAQWLPYPGYSGWSCTPTDDYIKAKADYFRRVIDAKWIAPLASSYKNEVSRAIGWAIAEKAALAEAAADAEIAKAKAEYQKKVSDWRSYTWNVQQYVQKADLDRAKQLAFLSVAGLGLAYLASKKGG